MLKFKRKFRCQRVNKTITVQTVEILYANINNNEGNKKAKTILYAEYTDRSGFQIHIINNVADSDVKLCPVSFTFLKRPELP